MSKSDEQLFMEEIEYFDLPAATPIKGMLSDIIESSRKEPVSHGESCQYSLYGPGGYKPATQTKNSLPAGCYDIMQDSYGVFAVPSPPPTGLMLELPEMRSEHVISLAETFWSKEKDYKEGNEFVRGGAAYRLGILLYGPPGSGKSTTIKLISKKIVDRNGIVFHCSNNPIIAASFLSDFSKIEPHRKCVVILEDIDSLIQNYGESYYLELLDSAKTIDNVLFIATTNYPEKLDPRIYNRPGRFSHTVKVGYPTAAARKAFLEAILKNYRDVDYIVAETENFTVDHLSCLINAVYRQGKDLKEELARLRSLCRPPKSEEQKLIGF